MEMKKVFNKKAGISSIVKVPFSKNISCMSQCPSNPGFASVYILELLTSVYCLTTSFMDTQKKSQPSFGNVSLSLQVRRSRCLIFVQKYLVFQNNQKMFCCFYYVKMKTSNQCLKVSNIEMRGCNMALLRGGSLVSSGHRGVS